MATILDMVATKNREHYFVKAVQQDYMTHLRDTLEESALQVLMNFSENLACVVQGEVANTFYFRDMVSLFTAFVYRKVGGRLLRRSYGVLCDDLSHDICHVLLALQATRSAPTPQGFFRPKAQQMIPCDPFHKISRTSLKVPVSTSSPVTRCGFLDTLRKYSAFLGSRTFTPPATEKARATAWVPASKRQSGVTF